MLQVNYEDDDQRPHYRDFFFTHHRLVYQFWTSGAILNKSQVEALLSAYKRHIPFNPDDSTLWEELYEQAQLIEWLKEQNRKPENSKSAAITFIASETRKQREEQRLKEKEARDARRSSETA